MLKFCCKTGFEGTVIYMQPGELQSFVTQASYTKLYIMHHDSELRS